MKEVDGQHQHITIHHSEVGLGVTLLGSMTQVEHHRVSDSSCPHGNKTARSVGLLPSTKSAFVARWWCPQSAVFL